MRNDKNERNERNQRYDKNGRNERRMDIEKSWRVKGNNQEYIRFASQSGQPQRFYNKFFNTLVYWLFRLIGINLIKENKSAKEYLKAKFTAK